MNRFAPIVVAFLAIAAALMPAAAQDRTITVFAAASMKNALDEINAAYTAKTGIKVTASYAASSALAKQIEQGAPADVFISADTDWMDYAISKRNINEPTRVNLLGNSIVLIAPKDSKVENVNIGRGFDLAKLAGDGRIATGDVKAVPAGKYARAALEKLGSWRAAEPKFAMAESVRAALTLVARGAHQLPGAMGVTREPPLHLSTRRLWSWRDENGTQQFWAASLGAALVPRGSAAVWSWLTEQEAKS